jgi:hypothetical protein
VIAWRTIPDFPSYEVSEFGEVRRATRARTSPAGKQLNPNLAKRGYLVVSLVGDQGPKSRTIHRLVCEAFHGPCPPDKEQAAHIDGDRLNNHFSNLRWATRSENERDKERHGTGKQGERHHAAKLNWEDVRAIRESTASIGELAALYGVTKSRISSLRRNEGWQEPRRRAAALRGRRV